MQYEYDGVGLGVRCRNNLGELALIYVVIWRLQHFLHRCVKFVQANAIDRHVTLPAEEAFRELLKNRWPTTSYYRKYF